MSVSKKIIRTVIVGILLIPAIGFGIVGAIGVHAGISSGESSSVLLGLLGIGLSAGLVFLITALLRKNILYPHQGNPRE